MEIGPCRIGTGMAQWTGIVHLTYSSDLPARTFPGPSCILLHASPFLGSPPLRPGLDEGELHDEQLQGGSGVVGVLVCVGGGEEGERGMSWDASLARRGEVPGRSGIG